MIGCLIVLAVLIVVTMVLVYWISQRWRGWSADLGSQVVKQMIAQSDLAQQEKDDMNVQIDRLATAFRDNRISWDKAMQLMQDLSRSPLMTSFIVSAVDRHYLARSGLSDDEKTAGRVTVQRFVRGMIDESINEQGIDNAMRHVATKKQNGGWEIRPRDQVTDADLRAFLEAAKAEADKAGVPAEPVQIDPSDELKRIIDQALGQPHVEVEPAQPGERSTEPAQQ
jgi:hypothetical protein